MKYLIRNAFTWRVWTCSRGEAMVYIHLDGYEVYYTNGHTQPLTMSDLIAEGK